MIPLLIPLKGEERRDFSYFLASFSMRGMNIPALVYKDIRILGTIQL
jgi:hypothetical protein